MDGHNEKSGQGFKPEFEENFYQTKEGLMLIPTAKTPMVGIHVREIFQERITEFMSPLIFISTKNEDLWAKDKGHKKSINYTR